MSGQTDKGILAFGAYLPRLRLDRQAILAANGWFNPGLKGLAKGERAIANWDEDAITLAVEAARDALGASDRKALRALHFASTSFPFDDRQNSGVIAQALNLSADLASLDLGGSLRAGSSALASALAGQAGGPVLVVAADKRRAKAASNPEITYGDGAAAFLVGPGPGLARLIGSASETVDFVDHYRGQGRPFDYQWEERWVREEGYQKIVPAVVKRLLERTGVAPESISRFTLPCTLPKVPQAVAKRIGIAETAAIDTLHAKAGDTGAAHPLLLLALALEEAKPGERILACGFGQGCDALLFEAMPALAARPKGRGVAGSLARRKAETNYARYLTTNDLITIERGLRAELDKQTALTTLYRNRDMLLGLVGGRCTVCGTRQFPKSNICVNPNCHAHHTQEDQPFADMTGRLLSYTADQLTYSPDPPAYYGMVQFDEGGRMMIDFTDIDAGTLEVGQAMRMVFRVKDYDPQRGFTRYFWKATPA